MLKFAVVLHRRADMSAAQFNAYFRDVHGPLAERLPGLKRYVQNTVAADPKRPHPGWDGIAELYFEDWAAMEAAWASAAGAAATRDLEAFVDLSRTTWSVVDEATVIG